MLLQLIGLCCGSSRPVSGASGAAVSEFRLLNCDFSSVSSCQKSVSGSKKHVTTLTSDPWHLNFTSLAVRQVGASASLIPFLHKATICRCSVGTGCVSSPLRSIETSPPSSSLVILEKMYIRVVRAKIIDLV